MAAHCVLFRNHFSHNMRLFCFSLSSTNFVEIKGIKRNESRGIDQVEWMKMNRSRSMNQEEWIKKNRPRGPYQEQQIMRKGSRSGSRGRDQDNRIKKRIKRKASRESDQDDWIKRNRSRGIDQEKRIKRWIKRNMYWRLSPLKNLKCKRTHCEWLPGKRMYSTERRTEKNFCLFSYSSSSSFIVHPMLDQVRPGHIESSRSIRYL